MKVLYLFFIVVSLLGCLVSLSLADPYNPEPADGDVILPMPNGASIVFRRVFIGEGDKPFALKEFKVGDLVSGGFKEFPTDVVVGGSFIEKNPHGEPDWVYYIGKYEVTEAQYYAVMDPSKMGNSQMPITNISWFETQEFVNTYNLWLFEHAQDKLPKNEETHGYVRLPTEIEWEFAARGGSEVPPAVFDKKHPYSGELNKYEWFSGPHSSHDKLKQIGLRQPNPLGIHDMLGNASEMTSSFYQIEYYQGRFGGFVARGGNFLTTERHIRSSLRSEIPFYKNLKASKQETLGLRLVIASPIYASAKTDDILDAAWPEYVATTRKPPAPPGGAGGPAISVRRDLTLAEARNVLQEIETQIQTSAPDMYRSLEGHIGSLKASFTNLESTVQKAEHDSAYAWVKIAVEAAFFVNRESKRLPRFQKALKIAKDAGRTANIESISERIAETEQNIQDGIDRYSSSFQELEKIRKDSINTAFEKYTSFLKRRGAGDEHISVNLLVKTHFEEYLHTRRLNIEKWKADLQRF